MEFNFKDTKSKKLFDEVKKLDLKQEEPKEEDDIFDIKEEVLFIKEKEQAVAKKEETNSAPKELVLPPQENTELQKISLQYLQRIESKQNAIIEILETVPLPTPPQEPNLITTPSHTDVDNLQLNLRVFNTTFGILFTQSSDSHINALFCALKEISENLSSNSFRLFAKENSPVQTVLKELNYLGMGDSIFNELVETTINLVTNIANYAKQDIFEQCYSYANLLLEKGLILNAITLFNEAIGMYIIESVKKQSSDLNKYVSLIQDAQTSKLYSQAKDFFIHIFLEEKETTNTIPFFPHHKTIKKQDKEIERKFKNIQTTWRKKGNGALFERYATLAKRVRTLRNSLAHGNLDTGFQSLVKEITSLNHDFLYLAITKNIFKK